MLDVALQHIPLYQFISIFCLFTLCISMLISLQIDQLNEEKNHPPQTKNLRFWKLTAIKKKIPNTIVMVALLKKLTQPGLV